MSAFADNGRRVFHAHAFKIYEPQNLPVFRLQLVHRAVNGDTLLISYHNFLELCFVGGHFVIFKRESSSSCRFAQIITRKVAAYCVEPGFERGLPVISRALCDKLYKGFLRQVFRLGYIRNERIDVEDQSVAVFSYDFGECSVFTCKEAAVATCTVIHKCLLSERRLSGSFHFLYEYRKKSSRKNSAGFFFYYLSIFLL